MGGNHDLHAIVDRRLATRPREDRNSFLSERLPAANRFGRGGGGRVIGGHHVLIGCF